MLWKKYNVEHLGVLLSFITGEWEYQEGVRVRVSRVGTVRIAIAWITTPQSNEGELNTFRYVFRQ